MYHYQRLHILNTHKRGRKMLWQWQILLRPSSWFGFLVEATSKYPSRIVTSYINLIIVKAFPKSCGKVTFSDYLRDRYLYFYENHWEWIGECYVTKRLSNQPYFIHSTGSRDSMNGTLSISIFWSNDCQKVKTK